MQELPNISSEAAHIIAHEVRNPLTNINLSLDILENKSNTKDPYLFYQIIRNNCKVINDHMTNLLLSFSNATAGFVKQSVNMLLDEALQMAADRIILRHIKVEKFYTADTCEITVDRPKIKIALLNIIINAIEAMPAGKGILTLTTKITDGKCMVTIEDNGIGINKEMLDKVFRPYFTSKSNGIGLGLPATQAILALHKATVAIESEENRHTRFIISFNTG